jgi:hypothetical protein
LDAVLEFGKQLARDHQMPFPSYDSAKAVTLTLFAAAHRSAGAATELLRHRWGDEAQVIGRSVFEHVIYAYLINQDDKERRLFVHYGASLGRWDEIDAYLQLFPDTDQSLLAPTRLEVHRASIRAVEDLGLVQGDTEQARKEDLKTLVDDPEALYVRLKKAYPKHQRRRVRAWCDKNLYDVARKVDQARGNPTFLTVYKLLYVNASRFAHSDPSTVGLVRTDDPATLLMGPDPSWTVPVVTAIGQLLLGVDELVNEVFQLGLDQRLGDAASAFQASVT